MVKSERLIVLYDARHVTHLVLECLPGSMDLLVEFREHGANEFRHAVIAQTSTTPLHRHGGWDIEAVRMFLEFELVDLYPEDSK